jgi:hypothetical protein
VGGPSAVHLGGMEQTERVRDAGGRYVGSLQSRYVGEAKPESHYCNRAANGGRGKERTSGRRFHGRDFEASGRWQRARGMQRGGKKRWN